MDLTTLAAAGGGVFLLLRWWIVGWCWRGLSPVRPRGGDPRWDDLAGLAAQLASGFLLTTLLAAAELAAGVFTPWAEGAGAVALALAGWALGRRRPAAPGLGRWGRIALLALAVAWSVLQTVPRRGEWMLGGWDPGIYVHQGVTLARDGAWRPPPDRVWSALQPEELSRFTRTAFGFTEAYPVVPLDPARRSLEPFFFPLTPVVMAQLYRAGGLTAVCRTNELFGALGALLLAAAVWRLTRSRPAAAAAGALLLTHPIWTYHLHFPTSEVVQVVLLSGLALGWAGASRGPRVGGWMALFLFAAGLNRLAFLPCGAALMLLDALRRPAARGRIVWGAALAAAAVLDALAVPWTVGRLKDSQALLLAATLAGWALTAATTAVLRRAPRLRGAAARGGPWLVPAAAAVAWAGMALLAVWRGPLPPWFDVGRWNANLVWNFGGAVCVLLAGVGLLAGAGRGAARFRAWHGWLLFLLAGALSSLLLPQIARLAPWAVRRQVEFTLPLLVLGVAQAVAATARWTGGWRGRARGLPAVGLLVLVVAAQAPSAGRAWRATEYDGLDRVLRQVAARIDPRDIVIADHFWWATPLRRLYGRDVLNGEVWTGPPPRSDDFRYAVDRLRGLAAARGGRLLLLATTGKRLAAFPIPLPDPPPLWESESWTVREVIQSSRARRIKTETKQKTFRLYLCPPLPPPVS